MSSRPVLWSALASSDGEVDFSDTIKLFNIAEKPEDYTVAEDQSDLTLENETGCTQDVAYLVVHRELLQNSSAVFQRMFTEGVWRESSQGVC